MRQVGFAAFLALTATVSGVSAAEKSAGDLRITGTIDVAPELAGNVAPDDRLIIKIYHPGERVELDPTYKILDKVVFPYSFTINPMVDMNGRTRHKAYVVEVITDKNADVLGIAPGELMARTADTVPLGAAGVALTLDKLRE